MRIKAMMNNRIKKENFQPQLRCHCLSKKTTRTPKRTTGVIIKNQTRLIDLEIISQHRREIDHLVEIITHQIGIVLLKQGVDLSRVAKREKDQELESVRGQETYLGLGIALGTDLEIGKEQNQLILIIEMKGHIKASTMIALKFAKENDLIKADLYLEMFYFYFIELIINCK